MALFIEIQNCHSNRAHNFWDISNTRAYFIRLEIATQPLYEKIGTKRMPIQNMRFPSWLFVIRASGSKRDMEETK